MDEIYLKSSLKGNKLVSTTSVPRRLWKYFNSFTFFATYDAQLSADLSILNIPLLSNLLPLAWLTGTDVHVETLDKNYVKAMNSIKHEFNLIFPRGRFTTEIIVDDLVENKTQAKGIGLLFTGGIDSTYSMIDKIDLKPRLIMFSGIQHYQLNSSYDDRDCLLNETYNEFAKRQGLDINFIKTNIIGVLNDNRIAHDFHKVLRGTGLWLGLQFPLVLLSLPAPLSIGRFNRLLISASVDPTHDYAQYPHSSQPRIDEKFAWADLKVSHHGYIHRFSKTRLIKEFSEKNQLEINVCNKPPPNLINCSNCEKCYRTIASLVLEGVDPNCCGFNVDNSTFKSMQRFLIKKKADALAVDSIWKKLQPLVPKEIDTDFFGSRNFFYWFKDLDIKTVQKRRDLYWVVYNSLPYPLALLSDALIYSARKHLPRQMNRTIDPFSSFLSLIRFSLDRKRGL